MHSGRLRKGEEGGGCTAVACGTSGMWHVIPNTLKMRKNCYQLHYERTSWPLSNNCQMAVAKLLILQKKAVRETWTMASQTTSSGPVFLKYHDPVGVVPTRITSTHPSNCKHLQEWQQDTLSQHQRTGTPPAR